MPDHSPLLALDQVHKHYPLPDGQKADVLSGVSFNIHPGETIAVTGPSGSGKSTLLNLMGLLDTPTSGTVFLDGQNVSALDEAQRAHLRNQRIGFVFQLHHLLPQCTVLENVLLPTLAENKKSPAPALERAHDLLRAAGLADKSGRKPAQLSGGEALRTAVVRALINDPVLLLADEPTGSLDRRTAAAIAGLFSELNRTRNLAMVVVTHSQEMAATMQTQYHLVDGTLVRS